MNPLYCSKGHANPTGTRFCLHCGEKLQVAAGNIAVENNSLSPGMILGDRYRFISEIGHGGFGRTYLAEDLNRFNERCVLKEFAPQAQGTYALQKAEELFEREAGVLYALQHPQIPRFRELFRVNDSGKGRLFLVQDYVDGQSYRALLESRKRQGLRFTEPEVKLLMLQILPVLEYIHSLGAIHRDISPENIILRNSDGLPVLIDFGGVKQVAATVQSQYQQPGADGGTMPMPTRLGKVGYAPDEQMQRGVVFPHSDLYALAATVLVLATCKEPRELIDGQTLLWDWRREVSLSQHLGAILDKMLERRPGDRYQSARAVLDALQTYQPAPDLSPTLPPPPPPPVATEATAVVAPAPHPHRTPVASNPPHPQPQPHQGGREQGRVASPNRNSPNPTIPSPSAKSQSSFIGLLGKVLVVLVIIGAAGAIGWVVGNTWLQSDSQPETNPPETIPPSPTTTPPVEVEKSPPPISTNEQQRQKLLEQRRQALGISQQFYTDLVNEVFWAQNPQYRGQTPGTGSQNAPLRERRDNTAAALLGNLEQANLSSDARRRLGSYGASDRQRWKEQVNKLHLSSRALYDLTDAKYLSLRSDYSAKRLNLTFQEFLNKPIGQIWHAIAADNVKSAQSGTALQTIRFAPGTTSTEVSRTLKRGDGIAYIAQLNEGQAMQVQLQGSPSTLLSIYPPSNTLPALLEDSKQKTWSGNLAQAGYYEFVVVSNSSKPVDFKLNLTVENAESTPPPVESETPTPSPSSTDEGL